MGAQKLVPDRTGRGKGRSLRWIALQRHLAKADGILAILGFQKFVDVRHDNRCGVELFQWR